MKLLKGFYMCLGMFTAIPLPFFVWDLKLAVIMVANLPLVGLLIGGLWWGALQLLFLPALPDFPVMLVAAVATVIPFWLAGFIHLDGYIDTSDAILSRRELPDMIRIMKDPNVGAFAVIMLVILLLLQFSAIHAIVSTQENLVLLVAIPMVSRLCSATAIFTMQHSEASNYMEMLGPEAVGKTVGKVFLALLALAILSVATIMAGLTGVGVIVAVVLGYGLAIRKASRAFKGISGDLLGYALVIGELCGLIALAVLTI